MLMCHATKLPIIIVWKTLRYKGRKKRRKKEKIITDMRDFPLRPDLKEFIDVSPQGT